MSGDIVLPTTGTFSGLTEQGYINTALADLATDHEGGTAPTTSSTGLSSTAGLKWHDTGNNLLKLRDQADSVYMPYLQIDETNKLVGGVNSLDIPGGRLTLSSNTPVMTADVVGATEIYYSPAASRSTAAFVPLFTGTYWFMVPFSQLGLVLDTTGVLSGNLYDVFLYYASSAVQIGFGPSWSTGGGSTTARGTGSGSTAIQLLNGLWTNTNAIVLRNNSVNSASIPAGEALYVGTFLATANGQTTMQFNPAPASDGSNPVMGLWNAYNRLMVSSNDADTTSSWTYATATWRNANGQTANRIRYVDGLAQSPVSGTYLCYVQGYSGGGVSAAIGLERNWSSGNPSGVIAVEETVYDATLGAENQWSPALGLNSVSALEYSSGSNATTFTGGAGSGQCMRLRISLEM
jgi:hypothetical protein